jgi:hypothetical protein
MKILPLIALISLTASVPTLAVGSFFDPALPVHATPVDLGEAGILARGLLVRLGGNEWVVFDQDLMRPAHWFAGAPGKEPVTLLMMAQASWENPTRKAKKNQPSPTGRGVNLAPALPGIATDTAGLLVDPRPEFGKDPGRGSLEASGRKFIGYDVGSKHGVLLYRQGETEVREWYELKDSQLLRHLVVDPGGELLILVAGEDDELRVESNHPDLALESAGGVRFARMAASKQKRRVTISYGKNSRAAAATPTLPATASAPRWPDVLDTVMEPGAKTGPGWILDRIPLPEENPWGRRIRPADVTFLADDRAALVTFEGDVWSLTLQDERVKWKRLASGLSEPLAIGHFSGTIQVFSRNGLVRLHDRDGNGEADFYENHSSLIHQTVGTRGYPLDMEMDEEGRTWCTVGGIDSTGRGTASPPPNPHAGGIFLISADGSQLETVARRAREPFIARDPKTGNLAMSDQQGHFMPSSGIFPVTPGADLLYPVEVEPGKEPVPAVWIPHEQDTSSASPLWMRDTAFPAWEGGLLNISYGTGRLILVRPLGAWPAQQGAAIPLGIETDIPLLHARIHPGDGSVWLAGMRIYDSRVEALGGLGRLRPGSGAVSAPVDARMFEEGVILTFAGEIDTDSIDAEAIRVREWQYRRSPAYGSPRLRRDTSQGTEPLASGNVWLSRDKRSAFVHPPPETNHATGGEPFPPCGWHRSGIGGCLLLRNRADICAMAGGGIRGTEPRGLGSRHPGQ